MRIGSTPAAPSKDNEPFDAAKVRDELVQTALGSFNDWKLPDLRETIGPKDDEVFKEFDRRRRNAIDRVRAVIAEFTDSQLALLGDLQLDDEGGVRRRWKVFRHGLFDDLRRTKPVWYAGGFGHPDHVAEFDYWSKMPSFTVEEVLCLSVGIEPKEFDAKEIERLKRSDSKKMLSPIEFLLRRHEQLHRQFDPHSYNWRVQPKDFLAWIELMNFETHSEFVRHLQRYHLRQELPAAETAPSPQKEPDKREIDKIAQLFTAMAIAELGYAPGAQRSPIPKEISELAASMGMSITPETVLKYLRLGARHIPADWEAK